MKWEGKAMPGGARNQAGVPLEGLPQNLESAHGLLLRGVVTATYVVDDDENPEKRLSNEVDPAAIYCDVLSYSSMQRQQVVYLRGCLVSQEVGGMQRGRIFRPRAATIDRTDPTSDALDLNNATNVANLDGDHVLVGFIDGRFNSPVILRSIPHPSADVGNESRSIGNRTKLRVVDGDPDFVKHHGSYYGVNDLGDWVADTRFANDGSVATDGSEPAPPTDGKGSHRFDLPLDAGFNVNLWDMSSPESPQAKVTLSVSRTRLDISYPDLDTTFVVDAANGLIKNGSDGAADWGVLASKADLEHQEIRDNISALAEEVEKHRHALNVYFFPLIPNPGQPIQELIAAPLLVVPGGGGATNLITQSQANPGAATIDVDAQLPEYDPLLTTKGGDKTNVASERVKFDK